MSKLTLGNAKLGGLRKLTGGLGRSLTPTPPLVPDPTEGLEYVEGDEEGNHRRELDSVQSAFKARRERESQRYERATDSEFWFAVCFRTRAQKEAFLKAAALFEHGDKYLDGEVVAETLGIPIPPEI